MADAIVPIGELQGNSAVDAAQTTAALQGTGTEVNGQTTSTQTDPLAIDNSQLSETAQVVLLEQQGLTTTEIADELGIPPAEVESDLGAVVSAQQAADNTQQTQSPSEPASGAAAYSQVAAI